MRCGQSTSDALEMVRNIKHYTRCEALYRVVLTLPWVREALQGYGTRHEITPAQYWLSIPMLDLVETPYRRL